MNTTRRRLLGGTALMAMIPFALGFSSVYAQSQGGNEIKAATMAASEPVGTDSVQAAFRAWLEKTEMSEGRNVKADGTDFFIAQASSPVSAKPGAVDWVAAKTLAFNRAELAAKVKISRLIQQRIESERGAGAGTVAQSTAANTNPNTGVVTPADATKTQTVSAYSDIATASNLFMTGSFVAAQFNGPNDGDGKRYSVLVVLVSSPTLGELALSILDPSSKPPVQQPGRSIREFIADQKSRDPAWALENDGARVLVNEKGQQIVIGFGHAAYSDLDESIHEGEATSEATAAIQRFIGEKVDFNDRTIKKESIVIKDGNDEKAFLTSYDRQTKAVASKITLYGVQNMGMGSVAHPEGKLRVYTTMVVWTPDGSIAARRAAERAKQQETNVKANANTNNSSVPGAGSTPTAPPAASGLNRGPAQTGVKSGVTVNPSQF